MRLLGNCSSKNNYEYTDKDVQKIFNTLERELKNTKAKFNSREESKEDKFTLR